MKEYTYIKRVEMDVTRLEVGMFVGQLDKPWEKSSFAFQGFPIENQEQIERLRKECRKVYVDFKSQQAYDVYLLKAGSEVVVEHTESDIELVKELPMASELNVKLLQALVGISKQVLADQVVELESLTGYVEQAITSLKRCPQALLLVIASKSKRLYHYQHLIRVGVIAIAYGIELGLSEQQLVKLGLGGMLFDIGKLKVTPGILNKAGKIDKHEALVLREHPRESFNILSRVVGISDTVREIALSHHERVDGKGYPRTIHAERVSRYAKIISIIDFVDAVMSDRPYSSARPAPEAIGLLEKNKGSKFDKNLVDSFTGWMGKTPVGSLVEMRTGEVGIILNYRKDFPERPRIMLVSDELKQLGVTKVIDLRDTAVHSSGNLYRIANSLASGSFQVDVSQYINKDSFDVPEWIKKSNITTNSPFAKFL
ncbi:HD-GYP domain-containing protein [Aliikangiella sp. G2MR2-5]|uniref:HD-GYP domain-containing protein n=1 Tax=Aliikangiella sp. G2MR2-5 TaxID=2788943 RepID=UPI0018A8990C|nr:HD-GYP domain-containing protein [Aliikangiella sp. G2MR2-5]